MLLVEVAIHKRRVHEGVKNYVCKYCGKAFFYQHGKNLHEVQVHEQKGVPREKKLICDLCGKAFAGSGSLYDHRNRVHLKVHRFSCHFCAMKFGHKNDIWKHFRSHTNRGDTGGMEFDEYLRVSRLPEKTGGETEASIV